MSRQIVSYDDISLPYQPPQDHSKPPSKKRRRQSGNNKPNNGRHWDEPAGPSKPNGQAQDVDEEEEEGRELSHGEIWDDSALIDAWNAANEEYEAFHGPDKDWKKERVHKSPLWYNVPPSKSSAKAVLTNGFDDQHHDQDVGGQVDDSQPLDFHAFVPTHDPSLSLPALPDPTSGPLASAQTVTQDEAFSRALSAMYWGGYWTAVYHCQRNLVQPSQHAEQHGEEVEAEDPNFDGDGDGDDDDDEDIQADLVPTQR